MKTAFLAVTTLLASTMISTPALADGDDDILLSPVSLEGAYDPQAICEEALKPAAASGFQTEPTAADDSGWGNDGASVRDQNVGDPVPTGSPTASNVIVEGSYFRNGGSPNVWALAQATLTYPNSTQEYTTIQHLIRTVTADCRVWKYVGKHGANLVEPFGLQTVGNVAVDRDSEPGTNGFDTNSGPISFQGHTIGTLVCISPGKKGGTWTGKHGFSSADCAAASATAGGTIPSGNIPIF